MSEQMWQGFGFGEIGYLLIQEDIPAVAKARELFDLIEQAYSDDVAMAAVSSLVAHGLLEVGEDGLPRPRGAAAVFTYAIAEATRWTRIGFFSGSDEAVDGAVVVHAPDATVILQPRQGGAWVMVVKSPEVSDSDAIWTLIESFRDATASASIFIEVSDSAAGATLFADRNGERSWTVALGASSLWSEQRREDVGDDALRDLVCALVQQDLSASATGER